MTRARRTHVSAAARATVFEACSAGGFGVNSIILSTARLEKRRLGLGSLDAAVTASFNILRNGQCYRLQAVTIREPARQIGRGFHAELGSK